MVFKSYTEFVIKLWEGDYLEELHELDSKRVNATFSKGW